ncbi:MAG: hypothetical protein QOJ39_3489 [Candidatus Eremiobacteraeota bacterium]|jgi:uncharacterized protein YjbI with pentapeptide repeats/beta-lactamase regulating signal transducer with metallopeptidase domain|nr:hypothetical protein [Candidatus Eremiobacteraeota bacterium]
MLEAIVGVALRAIFASVLLGGVLAALVLLATRVLALNAATRHALWTTALIATAVMPLAGIGVSIWKAANAVTPQTSTAAPAVNAAVRSAAVSKTANIAKPANAARHFDGSAAAAAPSSGDVSHRAVPSTVSAATAVPSFADRLRFGERFAFVRWTPRMSRNLALGVVGVWALGALAGLLGLAGSIVRVRGLKRRSSPLDGTLADELPWLTEIGPGREIYLRLSYETETPVAIGFRRPVILIPTELATADGLMAIEQLILHEHAHLRRHDDWTNLVQRVIERIFWFNPVVWLVGRRIALEREIASDDAVVEKTGEAHAYATSLWKLAREMRMPEHAVVAPGALLTRKQIAVRIEQLLDKKRSRLHRSPAAALGVVLASVLAVGFVATSAPAVEMPAAAPEKPSAPVATWHADGARTNGTPAQRVVNIAKPGPAKGEKAALDTLAKAAPGAKRVAVQQPGSKIERTLRYELVSKQIDTGGTSQSQSQSRSPSQAQPAPLRDRVVTVYVHDSPGPSARHENGAPGETALPHLPPVVVPPVPAVPAMPVMPALPQMRTEALTAVRAAKIADTKARLAHVNARVRNVADMGPEIGRIMSEAMASIPREIALEPGSGTTTKRVRLEGVKISRELIASCAGCSFRNADLRGVDLHGLKISADNLSGADMRGANLSGAKLTGVSLRGANLANADLRNAELAGVELRDANFDGVQFEGIKLVGVSFQGVSLRGTPLRSVIGNCTGCDFSRMDLHGQDLHGISVSGAAFSRADLHDANLSGVHFTGVDLTNANLTGVDFTNARLDGCVLVGAELHGARTTGMMMTGSGFDG